MKVSSRRHPQIRRICRRAYGRAVICLLAALTVAAGLGSASPSAASAYAEGAVANAVVTTTVDDGVLVGANHFTYTGASWNNCGGCNSGAYFGGFHYAYTIGDKAVFSFTGTQANLYGFKEKPGGIASVSVDGGPAVDVNFYAAAQVLSLVYTSPVLAAGGHSISLTVTGRMSGGASPTINLDKATVSTGTVTTPTTRATPTTPATSTKPTTPTSTTAGPVSVTVDDAVLSGTNHFAYSGASWAVCGGCNTSAYSGGFHYGYSTGDRVVFSFTGTQANLYGFKEKPGGIASVSVDGGPAVDVNFYAAAQVISLVYTSPVLAAGGHSISVTVTGRMSGGASPTINLDKATVSTGTVTTTTTPTTPTTPATSTKPTTPTMTTPTTPPGGSGFITRIGTKLYLNGKIFRSAGYNASPMMGCGADAGWTPTDAQRETYFAGLRPHSVTRIWVIRGNDLSVFDRIVAQAKAHGQYLAVVLADGAGGCEQGMDAAFYTSGYKGGYLSWINTVVPRYKNETAIAGWGLTNEGSGAGVSQPVYRSFIDTSAGRIKQLDPNHLVSAGTLAPYQNDGQAAESAGNTPNFLNTQESPFIDLISLHEYDANPGVSSHFVQTLKVALLVNKPIILGEYAIYGAQNGGSSQWFGRTCQTWVGRANMVQAKLTDYYSHPEVAWTNYWNFQQSTGATCDISLGGLNFASDPVVQVIKNVTLPGLGT